MGAHAIILARDRLTWEHIAFAFALAGPYGVVRNGEPQQLSERTSLSLLRSLLTTHAILHAPHALGALLSSIETCYHTLPNDLMDDRASTEQPRSESSDEWALPGVSIKSTVTIASNVFFDIGHALGSLVASFTKLQFEQGSREVYAKSAHSVSRELLEGHSSSESFQRWLTKSSDETRSIGKFDFNTSFGILHYFNEDRKWLFWRDWYLGFLDSKPLDWELQRRVALIDDAIWEAGPKSVAKEIERIQAKFELEQEVKRLKEELAALKQAASSPLIGDNGGPPLDALPAKAFKKDILLLWDDLVTLEAEIATPAPSHAILKRIAKSLSELALRIAAYCGATLDVAIKAGAKTIGAATGGLVVADYVQPETIQAVAQAITKFLATFP